MYLFVALFNQEIIKRERYFITGNSFEQVKKVFPNYLELNSSEIKGCIGYLKNKNYYDDKCIVLNISNLSVNENSLSFLFKVVQELNITNGDINKSLYRFAHRSSWIDKTTGYFPSLCIVNKKEFDLIRKGTPNIRKTSSKTSVLGELREENDWKGICDIYEPLEKATDDKELWENVNDLYDLAFACSKRGEPQNGKEKDRNHLNEVKRYRELSIKFFERCFELEPSDFRYASAIGYRYYLNVMELTKARGRRDGNVSEEITNALLWLNKALELNPRSIKDNYRKGKIILDKQIDNFKYSSHNWTKDTYEELDYIESEGIKSLEKLIDIYENIEDKNTKQRYLKEYAKGLYSLGSYYIQKSDYHLNEYIFKKIAGIEPNIGYTKEELQDIAKSNKLLEKCFAVETEISLDNDLAPSDLVKYTKRWGISPLDKLYKLGLVYFNMYFIKKFLNGDRKQIDVYGEKAYKYLNTAYNIGIELRKGNYGRRDTWFISEKMAWYFIISDQYEKAFTLIEKAKASYIINTYSIALLLSKNEENIKKAENSLLHAVKDRYNIAKNISVALLAHTYFIQGKNEDLKKLLKTESELVAGKSKKYLMYLGIGETV